MSHQRFSPTSSMPCLQRLYTHKMTYVHLLYDHIAVWMALWHNLLSIGYGAFSGASVEHLNKLIKSLELGRTNFSGNWFQQIIRLQRVWAFHYPEMLLDDTSQNQTCSRCKQDRCNNKKKKTIVSPSILPSQSLTFQTLSLTKIEVDTPLDGIIS